MQFVRFSCQCRNKVCDVSSQGNKLLTVFFFVILNAVFAGNRAVHEHAEPQP